MVMKRNGKGQSGAEESEWNLETAMEHGRKRKWIFTWLLANWVFVLPCGCLWSLMFLTFKFHLTTTVHEEVRATDGKYETLHGTQILLLFRMWFGCSYSVRLTSVWPSGSRSLPVPVRRLNTAGFRWVWFQFEWRVARRRGCYATLGEWGWRWKADERRESDRHSGRRWRTNS